MRNSGTMLIALIGAILVMSLFGAGVLVLLNSGTIETAQIADSAVALFAAETGISMARPHVLTNPYWCASIPISVTGAVGKATFSAVVSSVNPPVAVITSVGRRNDAQWTSIRSITGAYTRAIVVYRQNATPNRYNPRYRVYTNYKMLHDEEESLSVGADPVWQRVAASPATNHVILVTQNSSGEIWAQVGRLGFDGTSWPSCAQLNVSGVVPAANCRGCDVAYENLSGRALFVYSNGTSSPQYRIWTGSALGAENPVNVGASDPIQWIRLVPKPNSNEIMLLVRWRNTSANANCSSAIVWNGSSWGNLRSLEVNCKSAIDRETTDAAYTANGAVAVYIDGNNTPQMRVPKYRTFTASGWSGESNLTPGSLGSPPLWIRVQSRPMTAYACAVFLTTGEDLLGTVWNESTWSSPYETFQGTGLETSGYRDFDVAWSSQTNTLSVAYCPRNADIHSCLSYTVGAGISYGTMATNVPGATDGRWSVLATDPFTSDLLYASIDDGDDVNVQRWGNSSGSWTLFDEAEDQSSASYNTVDIVFRRDIVP